LSGDVKGKGKPVFCGKDGRWKDEQAVIVYEFKLVPKAAQTFK